MTWGISVFQGKKSPARQPRQHAEGIGGRKYEAKTGEVGRGWVGPVWGGVKYKQTGGVREGWGGSNRHDP